MARKMAKSLGGVFIERPAESMKTREDVVGLVKELHKYKRGYDNEGNKTGHEPIVSPVVFIDEIHRLPIGGQEHLGILMEEFKIQIKSSEAYVGLAALDIKDIGNRVRWSPAFTLVGATTNDGLLSKPFRDRFKLRFLFNTTQQVIKSRVKFQYNGSSLEIRVIDNHIYLIFC